MTKITEAVIANIETAKETFIAALKPMLHTSVIEAKTDIQRAMRTIEEIARVAKTTAKGLDY